ncbi:hypothetical protein [Thioclava sp. SK-1]|uniref:hypothetical protein n=1 Tax=Thioclava sp. SK-1 TaxID=1889770 RepID=UPI00114C9820|nr:hypothetical protein [Thioclava sp. SK-1]
MQRIDDAVSAERELEFASVGQPGGVLDPSMSGYLRASEIAWDDVTDSMSATIAAVGGVDDDYPLVSMAFAIRDILASENGSEYHSRIGQARKRIATICVRPEMSIIMKDGLQVLRATADRLDAMDGLHRYDPDDISVAP